MKKRTIRHTPIPWRYEVESDTQFRVLGAVEEFPFADNRLEGLRTHIRSRVICILGGRDEESEANARLIAAAPLLLAACRAATKEIDAWVGFVDPALLSLLRDAIHSAQEGDRDGDTDN